jgi:8-oxo-dGTP pyrophosphatase MutT (NUDIX family)
MDSDAALWRDRLLLELARYEPFDEREREMAERLRTFVASNPECFERTLASGHVTASAWVTDRERESVLLTHHRKLGRWLQLGGHADGEGDLRAVALREAREEAGIEAIVAALECIYDLDVHEIPAREGEPAHLHYDVRFSFYAERATEPKASEESHAVAWMALSDLPSLDADASVQRLAAKTARLTGRDP